MQLKFNDMMASQMAGIAVFPNQYSHFPMGHR
jgi:hypothetical protein